VKLLVDFSHRIVVEDLDSGIKNYYFIPRGTNTPLHMPPQEEELLHRAFEQEGIPVLSVEEQEVCLEEETAAGPRASDPLPALSPGVLSGGVSPSDIFGASQG